MPNRMVDLRLKTRGTFPSTTGPGTFLGRSASLTPGPPIAPKRSSIMSRPSSTSARCVTVYGVRYTSEDRTIATRAAITPVAIIAVTIVGAITADPIATADHIYTAAMAGAGITTTRDTPGDVAIAGIMAGAVSVSASVAAEGITVGTAGSLSTTVDSRSDVAT